MKKILKTVRELQTSLGRQQGLVNPSKKFLHFSVLVFLINFIEYSTPILIESDKLQAWHFDSPLPSVYVNILYLDTGEGMTQFMAPKGIDSLKSLMETKRMEEECLKTSFKPLGKGGKGAAVISEQWKNLLRKR